MDSDSLLLLIKIQLITRHLRGLSGKSKNGELKKRDVIGKEVVRTISFYINKIVNGLFFAIIRVLDSFFHSVFRVIGDSHLV